MHVFPKRHVPDIHVTTIHKNQSLEVTRMLINGMKIIIWYINTVEDHTAMKMSDLFAYNLTNVMPRKRTKAVTSVSFH